MSNSNDHGLAKRLKTFQERFGGNAPICDPTIRQKIQATNLERYGAKTPFESKAIRDKCRKTIQQRYGVDYAGACPEVTIKRKHTIRDHNYEKYCSILKQTHNIELISSRQQFITDDFLTFKCNVCGNQWTQCRDLPQVITCDCLDDNNSVTKKQQMIDFIQSVYQGPIFENYNVDQYVVDLYIPQYNVAFRWVDNWYDNELFRDCNYNRNLSERFKQRGIRVIHVFEYLWITSTYKLQYLIKQALHIWDCVLYAKYCDLRSISSSTFHDFLVQNHLGNYVHASTRLGLFYNDQLVAVAGFGKGRYTKSATELYRFCVKNGYQVVGALGKLIKHCPFDTVFSYVDKACYTGNGYLACGFKLVGETKACGYVYSNGKKTYDRISCQKHKQFKKFGRIDPNLTESENMAINGFYRVFDCGAYRFQWNRNQV